MSVALREKTEDVGRPAIFLANYSDFIPMPLVRLKKADFPAIAQFIRARFVGIAWSSVVQSASFRL